MSRRDHGLLEAAGVSVAEAAGLFNRSRQAIYTGLSNDRNYFSVQDVMVLLHDAKRRDSDRLDSLTQFIVSNFSETECELILFEQVGCEQVLRVAGHADDVFLVCNGNTDHLKPSATFAKVLLNLLNEKQSFRLIVPGDWVVACIEQNLGLAISKEEYIVSNEMTYLPSFVVMNDGTRRRAFFFMRMATEEMLPEEAKALWMHLLPMLPRNDEHKVREAG